MNVKRAAQFPPSHHGSPYGLKVGVIKVVLENIVPLGQPFQIYFKLL